MSESAIDQTINESNEHINQPINQSNGSNGHTMSSSIDIKPHQPFQEPIKSPDEPIQSISQSINQSTGPNTKTTTSIRQSINESNDACPQVTYAHSWRWPSIIYFGWLTPMLSIAYKRSLQFTDLWAVYPAEEAQSCMNTFDAAWDAELKRVQAINQTTNQAIKSQKQAINDAAINGASTNQSISQSTNQPVVVPSLTRVISKLVGVEFLFACFMFSYTVFDTLIGPQILKKLTAYSINQSFRSIPVLDGYQWALYLFGSAVISAICRSHSLNLTNRLFIRIRNMLVIALYQKSLRLPMKDRKDGQINNLMSSDTQKIVEFALNVHQLWSSPIILGVGVYQLYAEVGWPGLLGLAVMMFFLPIAGALMGKQMKYQSLAAKETDQRINLVNEIIQSIKVIKLAAWVQPFLHSLDAARERELYYLKKFAWLKSVTFGTLLLVPLICSITIFGAHVGTGGNMDPTTVFTTLALVNVIRMPFTFLPLAIASFTQVIVALRRMSEFLNLPEIDESQREVLDHAGVVMDNAEFTWGEAEEMKDDKNDKKLADAKKQSTNHSAEVELTNVSNAPVKINQSIGQQTEQVVEIEAGLVNPTQSGSLILNNAANEAAYMTTTDSNLKNDQVSNPSINQPNNQAINKTTPPRLTNVNLNLKAAQLVLIIGPVGCGKSTLLYGMLGEVAQSHGRTRVGGALAYVPQSAFIINATMRDNIVFGEEFDEVRYRHVLYACALLADIELLANGDMTEIGERGINLSGGQKQRISIARAAYNSKAKVVLLDDPLSAVDMHVAQHIFTHCLNGLMADRLRVLVTHSMAFVDAADQIVMLKETSIKDSFTAKVGTAAELRTNDSEFVALLERYHAGIEVDNDDESKAKRKANKDKKQAEESNQTSTEVKKEHKADLTEAEEREEGTISLAVYKRYIISGGGPAFYVSAVLLFLLTQGSSTGSDVLLSLWSNDLVKQKHTTGFWIGLYGALVAAALVFMILRTTTMSLFGVRASRTLHHDLAQSVMGKSMTWFDRTPGGRIVNRFTKDMYLIDLMLAMMLEFAISTSLGVLGIIVIIAMIVPIALAMFAILAVLYVYVVSFFRCANRDLQRLESVSRTPIFTHFSESLIGTPSIRALGVQHMYRAENLRRVDFNTRPLYFSRAVNVWLQLRLNLIGAVIVGGSAVLAVASPDIDGAVSAGNFGLLVTYALNVSNLLNVSVILMSQTEAMMNSVERVDYYSVERDQEQWKPTNPALSESVQGGHWPSKGQMSIKRLELRYRDDLDLVLKGVDLDIPAGSRVGIVGRTGSGKSSLFVALFRLVEPCGGSITIDGVNLAEISLDDVRSNLAIIPQDSVLFQGTFRHNLDPHGVYDDDALWLALDHVQLRGVVERMPQQLGTSITEAGNNLSTGQKQLLCMARALLKKPKVICLDEATASVDIQTDALIQDVIRLQFKDATILTIAHRLNTILDYDMIVVMDQGRIAEIGKPQELIRANGIFASMLHDRPE